MQDNFILTRDDVKLIAEAKIRGGNIWEDGSLDQVKQKIKDHFLIKTQDQCCYCRKNFTGEFRFVIDIEHILPKSIYPELIFELVNLSVSCKRCNMKIKRENTAFLIDPIGVVNQIGDPSQYLISHPNLDNYFEHMTRLTQTVNDKKSVKYIPLTDKGIYTYAFFKLHQLEIDTLNIAQGITDTSTELSEKIPPTLANDIQRLLDRL